ncbi:ATP-binding protein [Neobacillus sp. NPDC093127]|uniref:ATP-binding protein n=1 Tax=Neobacillus sp. NPDC093127 TaxID=3364296 RepID=UPI00380D3549
MRFLKKMRLINWHYFNDEIIEFHRSGNLITGGTGAGKSTIIDALQVLFVGNLKLVKFNQSATDKRSKRSITSYLRGSVNSEGLAHKRGKMDFSSYIVVEIELQKSKKKVLLGVVFDFNSKSMEYYHSFFQIEGIELTENLFYKEKNELYTREEFQDNLKRNKIKNTIYKKDSERYINDVKQTLGGVRDSFFKLIQKGIAFESITDIKHFVYEFVLDSDPLNSENLRENFERVRELENLIQETEKQILALTEIKQQWTAIENLSQGIESSYYISKKSAVLNEEEKVKGYICEKQEKTGEFEKLIKAIQEFKSQHQAMIVEINQLSIEIEKHSITTKMKEIKEQINQLIQEVNKLGEIRENQNYKLKVEVQERDVLASVLRVLGREGNDVESLHNGKRAWEAVLTAGMSELSGYSPVLLNNSWRTAFKWAQDQAVLLKQDQEKIENQKHHVTEKIRELKKDRVLPSSHPSMILKTLLTQRLSTTNNAEVPVYIVCEVIDVPDEKWNNAVEGYLKNLKFNIIVPPEHFDDALQVYHDHKFSHPISGVGLVNIKKMEAELRPPLKGSLAEEITTDNSLVKSFTDYVLGTLIKCEEVQELKKHKRSITSTCMVYQNHTARQIPKKDYEIPYIGREAVKKQLEKQKEYLDELEQSLSTVNGHLAHCDKLNKMRSDKQDYYEGILSALNECAHLSEKEQSILSLQQSLLDIDTSEVDWLNLKLKELKEDEPRVGNLVGEMQGDSGKLEEKITNLTQLIDDTEGKKVQLQKNLEEYLQSLSPSALDRAKERWEKIDSSRPYGELVGIYENNARSSESRRNNLKGPLILLRTKFNETYHFGADSTANDNERYQQRLTLLVETKLVEFNEQVAIKKENAYRCFQEDFILKLKERIERSKQTFDALNFSLNKLDFGGDKYRFRCLPNQSYIHYYEMIMDHDLLSDGLFSYVFQEKYESTLNDFFKELSFDEHHHSEQMERLMDYRTYLDFDIDISDRDGNEFKYSKKFGSNSGGESQVPFYIAVLASFFNTYQMHRKDPDTFRLVLFDEAFNRMDGERVEECIQFIHECGFQPIVVTPTTSLQVMAPLLPCTTMVIKHGFTSQVEQITKDDFLSFRRKEELEHVSE